jgi:hypothetical protein
MHSQPVGASVGQDDHAGRAARVWNFKSPWMDHHRLDMVLPAKAGSTLLGREQWQQYPRPTTAKRWISSVSIRFSSRGSAVDMQAAAWRFSSS